MDDSHLGCDRVHQESRAACSMGGHCRGFLPSRAPAGPAKRRSALVRALHRGWNAAGSVGECEKLSARKGWLRTPLRRRILGMRTVDFHGGKSVRTRRTHRRRTRMRRMARKGQGQRSQAELQTGICWWENRNGLIVKHRGCSMANGNGRRRRCRRW